MLKNTSGQKWRVFAFTRSTNEPLTGNAANITAKISIDYGSRTALADTNPTEAEDGYYYFDLSQAETNGHVIDIFPESSTSGVQVIGVPASLTTSNGSGNAIAVLPGRDRAVADAGASTITVKLGEIITIARAVVDANGQPMDLSGFTNLQFVVQDARGLDLAKVDHADITISGGSDDTYSFVTPSGMTSKLGVFDFSLNQVGGGQIVGGKWIVLRRAVAD